MWCYCIDLQGQAEATPSAEVVRAVAPAHGGYEDSYQHTADIVCDRRPGEWYRESCQSGQRWCWGWDTVPPARHHVYAQQPNFTSQWCPAGQAVVAFSPDAKEDSAAMCGGFGSACSGAAASWNQYPVAVYCGAYVIK